MDSIEQMEQQAVELAKRLAEAKALKESSPALYAARELDAISGDDPESAHGEADTIMVRFLPTEVREAYQRVIDRCGGFWYA